jgi:hypothetical protein
LHKLIHKPIITFLHPHATADDQYPNFSASAHPLKVLSLGQIVQRMGCRSKNFIGYFVSRRSDSLLISILKKLVTNITFI